jgi:hypothetical protein
MCSRRWLSVATRDTFVFMTMRYRRRHCTGLAAAAAAFVVATGAVVTSGLALAHPIEPGRHIVTLVSPPPPTYSSSETEAARGATCAAWDRAARSLASAGKIRAAIAEPNGSSPEARSARTDEKRVGVSSISFLRTQIRPATPAAVLTPVESWMATQINRLHAVNMRDWDASNVAADQANELVSKIVTECGLR